MSINNTSITVLHDETNRRFEIRIDSLKAELTYLLQGDTIVFTHTGVPAELEGQGLGSKLVRAGLEFAKEKNLRVKTQCWFVEGYIEKHPEVWGRLG